MSFTCLVINGLKGGHTHTHTHTYTNTRRRNDFRHMQASGLHGWLKMVLAVNYPTILSTIVKALYCNIIINCVIKQYAFIFVLLCKKVPFIQLQVITKIHYILGTEGDSRTLLPKGQYNKTNLNIV